MRKLIFIIGMLFTSSFANAETVLNDSIGNDPAKEKLCIERLPAHLKGKTVPFKIDNKRVASIRAVYPDVTFVAADDGGNGSLVECRLREGTGRYEPDSYTGQSGWWSLIKPKQFEPGINTDVGQTMAYKVCLQSVLSKSDKGEPDHYVSNGVFEITGNTPGGGFYRAGVAIAGKKAERYDIAVKGSVSISLLDQI